MPFTLLLALAFPAQDGLGAADSRALERLAELPDEERGRIADAVFDAVLACGHPLAAAAQALRDHPRTAAAPRLPPDPARAYDPQEYAPALKLRTRVFQADDAAWKSVHRRLLGGRTPPPWPAERMRWDPGRDALIVPATPPAPAATVSALLAGCWPPDGRVACWAEAALDEDSGRNPAADYFEHAYRNRDGGVYAGIRLADVWDCGREFEVSDVEAIAWLRLVGGGTALVSPIPGAQHREIYRRIEASWVDWRAYWSLREALASRMLEPWTDPDPMWRGARDLLDEAWSLRAHDAGQMNAWLRAAPERASFLAAVRAESAAAADEAELARRDAARAARASLAAAIRDAARDALRAEGLYGFGLR